jgi:hypothetical protein
MTGDRTAPSGARVTGATPALVLVMAAACSSARAPLPTEATPGVVFPVHLAEGKGEGEPIPSAEPPPRKHVRPSPPDPEPLRTPKQYELEIVWENHRAHLESARAIEFRQPMVTERRMGRFAVELWIGQELVDRVRFDFPLLAAEDPEPKRRRPLHEPPTFAGSVLKTTVLVPASPRARRALILDRATGRETPVDWPPVAPIKAPAPSTSGAPPSSAAPSTTAPPRASSAKPTPSSGVPDAESHGGAHPR